MLSKFFQRQQQPQPHQNQNQNQSYEQEQTQGQYHTQHQHHQHHSQPTSPVQPAYPMSRTAQWVAQQAQQEFQLVPPRSHLRQQQRQYEQEYHTYNTPDWQAPQQKSRRTHRKRHKTPLMDLSSLEGPPIEDPRLLNASRSTIPHVREEPATPSSPPPCLLWKPLPPRPASAEPQSESSRQRFRLDIPGVEGQAFFADSNLRHGLDQGNRRSAFEDTFFSPDDPRLAALGSGSDERARSTTPMSMNMHIPPSQAQPQPQSQPRPQSQVQSQTQRSHPPRPRSQNSNPLVWMEDEERWVITHAPNPNPRSSHSPRRLPSRLRNATARPPRPITDVEAREPRLDISVLGGEDVEWLGVGVPPDYESHQFSPTHVQRLRDGEGEDRERVRVRVRARVGQGGGGIGE